jgi:hypothetical protein
METRAIPVLLSICVTFVLSTLSWAAAAQTWTVTGSMNSARYGNTQTLLNNGKVLVAGGSDGSTVVASAELYRPATRVFALTGNMNSPRYYHTATLLKNGMVLVAGGLNASGSGVVASAELYDTATGVFTPTSSMNTARYYHTATLLKNGMVLVAGGSDGTSALASVELFDPATGTFTPTGSLNAARFWNTATLLHDGKVLISGGYGVTNYTGVPPLTSAELYNPTTRSFTYTGSLNTGRSEHTATLSFCGTVLMAGGVDSSGNSLASSELYDPATGLFNLTIGSMNTGRVNNTATLLNNGSVLVAGGVSGNYYTPPSSELLASAELYHSAKGIFTATGSMNAGRFNQTNTATLLDDGTVLVAGGSNGINVLASAELYIP